MKPSTLYLDTVIIADNNQFWPVTIVIECGFLADAVYFITDKITPLSFLLSIAANNKKLIINDNYAMAITSTVESTYSAPFVNIGLEFGNHIGFVVIEPAAENKITSSGVGSSCGVNTKVFERKIKPASFTNQKSVQIQS